MRKNCEVQHLASEPRQFNCRWVVAWSVCLAMAASAYGQVRTVRVEVVADDAATGDGGNCWGGHQCRIVRTKNGVFTAYTFDGPGPNAKRWRLLHRRQLGWKIIAEGVSGREPVNLLAAPNGVLYVVGWPNGRAKLWSVEFMDTGINLQARDLDGLSRGHYPYGSAGIDRLGNLCILSSEGEKPGRFRWVYYSAARDSWASRVTDLDYRHCYTYVLPDNGAIAFVSTRDVRWESQGYRKPPGAFAYSFTAFGLWQTGDPQLPPRKKAVLEEKPNPQYLDVFCLAQNDAYRDTEGRIHVLYRRKGPTTGGMDRRRHAVFGADGKQNRDLQLPDEVGTYCRIVEDDQRRLYVVGSSGMVLELDPETYRPQRQTAIDLGGHAVEYSGFGLAMPRTGTPLTNFVDAVFPTAGGSKWIYCRIELYPRS